MKIRYVGWVSLVVLILAGSLAVSGCGKKPAVATDLDGGSGGSGGNGDGSGGSGSGTDRPGAGEDDAALKISDVFFDYDRYELRGDARSTLQSNARYLSETGIAVLLEGHCDERGTNEYNLALGQRRADAVRSYLIDLGVNGSRLTTISYGEERPFALGHDEAAWSQNRRVHFNTSDR